MSDGRPTLDLESIDLLMAFQERLAHSRAEAKAAKKRFVAQIENLKLAKDLAEKRGDSQKVAHLEIEIEKNIRALAVLE